MPTSKCAAFGQPAGVEVGRLWLSRVQVSEDGVHGPWVGGIHGNAVHGAYSVVLSGGYEVRCQLEAGAMRRTTSTGNVRPVFQEEAQDR